MAVVSKELIWRLRSVEQACNRQFLDVWASVEGNPMKAEYKEYSWGTIMHFSENPNNSVFNRAAARQEGMFDHIDEIEAEFEARGVPPVLEVSAADLIGSLPGSVLNDIHDRGYRAHDVEALYYGETDRHYAPPSEEVEVSQVLTAEDMTVFLDLNSEGWSLPEPIATLFKKVGPTLLDDPNFTAWIALLDGVPAGCAQLYTCQGVGYFADACVLKEYRRRGCPRALFSARLEAAREKGADLVFSIGEFASQSTNNMEAFGLRMATELWHWRKVGQ